MVQLNGLREAGSDKTKPFLVSVQTGLWLWRISAVGARVKLW